MDCWDRQEAGSKEIRTIPSSRQDLRAAPKESIPPSGQDPDMLRSSLYDISLDDQQDERAPTRESTKDVEVRFASKDSSSQSPSGQSPAMVHGKALKLTLERLKNMGESLVDFGNRLEGLERRLETLEGRSGDTVGAIPQGSSPVLQQRIKEAIDASEKRQDDNLRQAEQKLKVAEGQIAKLWQELHAEQEKRENVENNPRESILSTQPIPLAESEIEEDGLAAIAESALSSTQLGDFAIRISPLEKITTRMAQLEDAIKEISTTQVAEPAVQDQKVDVTEIDISEMDTNKRLRHTIRDLVETGLRRHTEYNLIKSPFDVCLVVGHPNVGCCGSILTIVVLLLTLVLQVLSVIVVSEHFVKPQFPENGRVATDFVEWRQRVGQHVQYYDPISLSSLTQRVCDQSNILEMADSKAEIVGAMQEYLPIPDTHLTLLGSGPCLVLVAVVIWTVLVLKKLQVLLHKGHAVLCLPWGIHTLMLPSETEHTLCLAQVSVCRFIWSLFILVIELAMTVVLGFFGTRCILFHSIDIPEILLNVVILKLMLKLDRLMFSLMPEQMKVLWKSLDPIPCPSNGFLNFLNVRFRGLDCRQLVLVTILILWVTSHAFNSVVPYVSLIEEAHDSLCGGDQSQLYGSTNKSA